jgi:hypothetical protein
MKKLLIVFLLVLLPVLCFAETKNITFLWEQATTDLPNLKEWRIKQSMAPGGPYTLATTVPYTGTPQNEYTATAPITVPSGAKTTLYFIATAVSTAGNESGPSNEVSAVLDFSVVTVPIRLRLEVITQ